MRPGGASGRPPADRGQAGNGMGRGRGWALDRKPPSKTRAASHACIPAPCPAKHRCMEPNWRSAEGPTQPQTRLPFCPAAPNSRQPPPGAALPPAGAPHACTPSSSDPARCAGRPRTPRAPCMRAVQRDEGQRGQLGACMAGRGLKGCKQAPSARGHQGSCSCGSQHLLRWQSQHQVETSTQASQAARQQTNSATPAAWQHHHTQQQPPVHTELSEQRGAEPTPSHLSAASPRRAQQQPQLTCAGSLARCETASAPRRPAPPLPAPAAPSEPPPRQHARQR